MDDVDVLGAGGEAKVYSVPGDRSLAAKVYLKPSEDRVRKLGVMAANPPSGTAAGASNPQIAWPSDLLWTTGRRSQVAGFLMPRVDGMAPIIDIYSPHTRLVSRPWFDYRLLLRASKSLAEAAETAHQGGYVVGDLNHSNIFVADDASVTLIDADSFQVRDPNDGSVFFCPVYTPEFTAPELHHQGLIKTERSLVQDDFGLGVLVFLMLMGGVHPFSGVHLGQGEPPPLFSRIASGDFPYSRNKRPMIAPPPIALPIQTLSPGIQELFYRCFEDGHDEPSKRPSALEWCDRLLDAEQELRVCDANAQHHYGLHQTDYPFPSSDAVANGRHRRPIPVHRTLSRNVVPQWRFQEQKMRRARVRTGVQLKTWHWAAIVGALWVGLPGLWALASFQVSAILPFVAFLAAIFYGMAVSMVAIAAGMVGWRRALSAGRGGRWITASAASVLLGGGLIAFMSVLVFFLRRPNYRSGFLVYGIAETVCPSI